MDIINQLNLKTKVIASGRKIGKNQICTVTVPPRFFGGFVGDWKIKVETEDGKTQWVLVDSVELA